MDAIIESYALGTTVSSDLLFSATDVNGGQHFIFLDDTNLTFPELLAAICLSELFVEEVQAGKVSADILMMISHLFFNFSKGAHEIALGYVVLDHKNGKMHYWKNGCDLRFGESTLSLSNIPFGVDKKSVNDFYMEVEPLVPSIFFKKKSGDWVPLSVIVRSNKWMFLLKLTHLQLKQDRLLQDLTDFFKISLALNEHRSMIYTVLTELYSNALEHGILKITSGLKESAEGIIQYYDERQSKLENLTDGGLLFQLSYQKDEKGKVLTVKIEDSGAGFDYQALEKKLVDLDMNSVSADLLYHGRGLRLIKSFCPLLHYENNGRSAIAPIDLSFRS